jgi:hypothetical protein
MEFKEFRELGIKTEDGVLLTKYLVGIHLANTQNAKKIKNSFERHGYQIDIVPGTFLKIFSMNDKEANELENVLVEVDDLGLKDVYEANLKVSTFKRSFLEKIKFCINNRLPFLNSDNTFIAELYDNEKFGEYSSTIPMEKIATVSVIENKKNDVTFDAEDKQVYNEVIEKLNYLVLAHPTDEFLSEVVHNVTNRISESILRKEYRFLSLNDMVKNVMFDGLDSTPENNIRIEDLIDQAFPNQPEIERGIAS